MELELGRIFERDMDYLIIEEFSVNPKFANIFLAEVGLQNATVRQCVHSHTDIQYGESDIEILVERDGKKYLIMIEDKIDALAMENQCNRYHERGKQRKAEGQFEDYFLFITAPEAYLQSDSEAGKYPHKISYEQLKAFFDKEKGARSAYKSRVIQGALDVPKAKYIPIEDTEITEFWQHYYAYKREKYTQLKLHEISGPRGVNAVWPWFSTNDNRMRVGHKSFQGYVDLTLLNMGDHTKLVADYLKNNRLLTGEMKVVRTTKSTSVRIQIKKMDFAKPFEGYLEEMKLALDTVTKLVELADKIDFDALEAYVHKHSQCVT